MIRAFIGAAVAAFLGLSVASALEPGGSARVICGAWSGQTIHLSHKVRRLPSGEDMWAGTMAGTGYRTTYRSGCLQDIAPPAKPKPTPQQCRADALTAYRAAVARCGG